jgi:hypothetical protein
MGRAEGHCPMSIGVDQPGAVREDGAAAGVWPAVAGGGLADRAHRRAADAGAGRRAGAGRLRPGRQSGGPRGRGSVRPSRCAGTSSPIPEPARGPIATRSAVRFRRRRSRHRPARFGSHPMCRCVWCRVDSAESLGRQGACPRDGKVPTLLVACPGPTALPWPCRERSPARRGRPAAAATGSCRAAPERCQ